jgi:cyclomaltodextrinase
MHSAGILVVFLALASARAQEVQHEFKYKPDDAPRTVHVAGDFNNWSSDASPMVKGGDGVWVTSIKLTEGTHLYKFVVNGDQWRNDPTADKALEADDGHGGKNSGVRIGEDAAKFPPPQPNSVNLDAVKHNPEDHRDRDIVSKEMLLLSIRTQANDVDRIWLHIVEGMASNSTSYVMSKISTANGFDRYGALVKVNSPDITYFFQIDDGTTHQLFPPGGAGLKVEMKPTFETPDWSKHAVWYQIFPERFCNGDPSNDPNDHDFEHVVPWTSNWWKAAPGEAPGDENFYKGEGNVWKRRYGGDVQGLIQALPYLQKLGVNAIYLNPVFEAESMHKYDTADYRHIDDNFGVKGDIAALQGETDDPATWKWTKSDLLFLDFVAKAHEMGFKVILDGVFNHVGKAHPFFQDVLKNGKNSKYADWFEITDFNSSPIHYKAWDKDDGALPVLKKDAARGLADGPRQHVLAITKRWLAPDGDPKKGVDGWRLDVPGDIPHPFWVEFRKVVKEAHPDAYVTGEIWTWAQPWLKGDQFDAVMNYRWADAAQKFFVNQKSASKPSEFNQYLSEMAYNYPFQVSLAQQNLFDSHDTDRFASMFVNPDLAYDAANRIQDNGPNYKPDKPTNEQFKRMMQAVAAQMMFVGAPMIYYGDEAGMWSPDDPSNRMPMVWEEMKFDDPQVKFNDEMFTFYQRAIALRQKRPELQTGFFRGIVMDDANGVYAFARDLGDQHAYVVINRSDAQRKIEVPVDGDGKMINWMDRAFTRLVTSDHARPAIEIKADAPPLAARDGKVTITLKPFATAVLTKP